MNIFDETLVIVVESPNVGGVYSVNGKAGYVTLDKSDIGISEDLVYLAGNQTISGVKTFITRPQVNGTGVLLSGEAAELPNSIVYSSGTFQPKDLLIKYVTGIQTGIISYDGIFPNIYFTEKPILFISLSYEGAETIVIDGSPGKNRYVTDLMYSNQTGFGINFSSQILETGLNLNVLAYGKGVNF